MLCFSAGAFTQFKISVQGITARHMHNYLHVSNFGACDCQTWIPASLNQQLEKRSLEYC